MTKKEVAPAVTMRVLKIATCPSLSGRSELTYHLGCNAECDIHVRVVANSGSGQFNTDWVALSLIEKLLAEHPTGKPLTSTALRPVFRGQSSNSPAFLFAVLKAESLVLPGADKDSGYLLGDIEAFKQAMSAVAAGDTNLAIAPEVPVETPKRKRSSKETA